MMYMWVLRQAETLSGNCYNGALCFKKKLLPECSDCAEKMDFFLLQRMGSDYKNEQDYRTL